MGVVVPLLFIGFAGVRQHPIVVRLKLTDQPTNLGVVRDSLVDVAILLFPSGGVGQRLRQVVHGAQDLHDPCGAHVVLVKLNVLRQVGHEAGGVHLFLNHALSDQVHDAGRALVCAAPLGNEACSLRRLFVRESACDHQWAGVRHRIVHSSDSTVFCDVEMSQQFGNRIAVGLAQYVRLTDVQEQIVPVGGLIMGVMYDAVGRGEHALAVDHPHTRPVTGEIEKVSGGREPAQFLGLHVTFQLGQRQCSDSADIDPRAEHRDCDGVPHFRGVVLDFKFSYLHETIVPSTTRMCNPFCRCRQDFMLTRHHHRYTIRLAGKLVWNTPAPMRTDKQMTQEEIRCESMRLMA